MKITVKNLKKEYKKKKRIVSVINDFSHEFLSGKMYLLKGSSGAGKTTLLSMLGLLDNPSDGEIYYDALLVSKLSEEQKTEIRRDRLGYIYQENNLFGALTIEENIKLAYMDSIIPNLDEKIMEALERVNLTSRMGYYPFEISGGEKQRVAIARAILKKPHILICDEPISNLDEKNAQILIDYLCEIKETENCIILVSCHTHHFDDYVDEIIVLGENEEGI